MKVFQIYTHPDGKDYTLPYYLPERKSRRFSVSIEFKAPGTKLTVVSRRNALFMGLRPAQVTVGDRPLGVHYLKQQEEGTWMTSLPQEIEQHSRQLARMRGRVLVGGLGLGLAVAYLEESHAVEQITVVEKSQSIIHMILPFLPKQKTKVVQMDLYDYLKQPSLQFDCAFYDIWQPTGEMVHMEHVIPLRRLSKAIIPQENIECWNEEEMLGQIHRSCLTSLLFLDLPVGDRMRGILDISEDQFQRHRHAQGMVWHWYHWLRTARPSKREAGEQIPRFMADLKDPEAFDSKWSIC